MDRPVGRHMQEYTEWCDRWPSQHGIRLRVPIDSVNRRVLDRIESYDRSIERIVDNIERQQELYKEVHRFCPNRELDHERQVLVCYVALDGALGFHYRFYAISAAENLSPNMVYDGITYKVAHVLYIPAANVAMLYIRSFLGSMYNMALLANDAYSFGMHLDSDGERRIKGLLVFIANVRGGTLRSEGDPMLFDRPPKQQNRLPNVALSYQYNADIEAETSTEESLHNFLFRPVV